MLKSFTTTFVACAAVLGARASVAADQMKPAKPVAAGTTTAPAKDHKDRKDGKDGRAIINGVEYDYQIRGQGEPLLLLHGGLGQLGHVRAAVADLHCPAAGDCRRPAGARPLDRWAIGPFAARPSPTMWRRC